MKLPIRHRLAIDRIPIEQVKILRVRPTNYRSESDQIGIRFGYHLVYQLCNPCLADLTGVLSDFLGPLGCAQAGFGFPLFVLAVERVVEREDGSSKTPFIFGFVRCLADTGADFMRIEDAKIFSDASEVIFSSTTINLHKSLKKYKCKTFIF